MGRRLAVCCNIRALKHSLAATHAGAPATGTYPLSRTGPHLSLESGACSCCRSDRALAEQIKVMSYTFFGSDGTLR